MTKAQQKFYKTAPWQDDCLTGSERTMALRLVKAGLMVEATMGNTTDYGYHRKCSQCRLAEGHDGPCGDIK